MIHNVSGVEFLQLLYTSSTMQIASVRNSIYVIIQARRQEMKWGVFVKKWTFPQRRVHYVSVFFILHFTYLGGVCTQHTSPACGPVIFTGMFITVSINVT